MTRSQVRLLYIGFLFLPHTYTCSIYNFMSRYELTDKVLWLLVPVALAASYYAAQSLLPDVKAVTSAPPVEESIAPKKVDDDAENHIPPDALRTISDGHSFELRRAAFRIALSQSLKPESRKILLRDLASTNPHRRDKAVFALWYLVHGPDSNDDEYTSTRLSHQKELQQPATYEAIVTALVNLLPLHLQSTSEIPDASDFPPSPVAPLRNPTHEDKLILLLLELIRSYNRSPTASGGVYAALEAGLVTCWIARYPFPCTLPQFSKLSFKRSDVNDLLHHDSTYSRDDYLMTEVFRQINILPKGREQLKEVGLAKRRSRLKEDFREDSSAMAAANTSGGRATDSAPTNGQNNTTNNTPNENDEQRSEGTTAWRSFHPPVRSRSGLELNRPAHSPLSEEDYLQRRRNREAMVIYDPEEDPILREYQALNLGAPTEGGTVAGPSGAVAPVRRLRPAINRRSLPSVPTEATTTTEETAYAASSVSFSSVGTSGSRTPDSMPGLMSPANEPAEGATEPAEAGQASRPVSSASSMGEMLEMAVRARDGARGDGSERRE